jgi:two-component system response regulator ResD
MDKDYILVLEDDQSISNLIKTYLEQAGFKTKIFTSAEDGLNMLNASSPKLVILDLSLSGHLDGLEFLKKARSISDVPVIIVTARGDEIDRILGLELGSDDYITKPFSPKELVARVKAILRRYSSLPEPEEELTYGSITLKVKSHEAYLNNEPIELTVKEFAILQYLLQHKGQVLSRQQLLDALWGPGWFGDPRTVDVHIRGLRKKFKGSLNLTTIWGVGYRLNRL